LIVVDGPDLGNEYEVEAAADAAAKESLTLGRDPRASVALSDSAVSREHCKIDIGSRGFRLVDLGSRNRTFLNGDPIENIWLKDGDILSIGDTELRFEDDSPPLEAAGVNTTIIKEVERRERGASRLLDSVAPVTGTSPSNSIDIEAVLKLTREVAATASLPDLFDRVLTELVSLLRADHAAFLMKESGKWVVKSQKSGSGESSRLRASLAVVDRAAAHSKAILSQSEEDESATGARPMSAMAMPLLGT